MKQINWRYLIFSISLLTLLGVTFCYWRGFDPAEERIIAGKIEDKPNVFYNQAHLSISEFTKKTFKDIEEDSRLPKKILFHYGERLNREFELKMIVVYWMREE